MTQLESRPDSASRPRRVARLRGATQTLLGPLWVTTFRDPVRSGRLRLDGLSGPERHLARAGLVTLVLLLVSALFADVWRRGPLLHLDVIGRPTFVPQGLLPVTLVALYLALLLIVWGALDAAPSVRVAVALLYAAAVAILGAPTVYEVSDAWILHHGPTVLRTAFWIPPGALVVSALLSRVGRLARWTTPALRAVCLVSFVTMCVSQLWMHVAFTEAGFQSGVQFLVHSGFTQIDGLSVPLVLIAAVAVIDFATDVSTSLAEPLGKAPVRWLPVARIVLLVVIAAKLWFEVVAQWDFWTAYVARQPEAFIRTLAALALLAIVTLWANRMAAPSTDSDVDEAKERLTLGGALVLAAAVIVGVFLLGVAELVVTVARDDWGVRVVSHYPTGAISDYLPIVAAVTAVAAGIWLLRRGSVRLGEGYSRELGSGLLVVGAWNVPANVIGVLNLSWGFSYRLVDVLVTVAVLVWLLRSWRRVALPRAALMLAVLIFSWLVMSRGDYISFLGGLLGLPAVVVVVFGVLYTLASGAGFTTESSRRLPREARTLMFVGYLLLSVTVLHWMEAIHQAASDHSLEGFYYLGIPLAAWLLARRIIPRGVQSAGDEVSGTVATEDQRGFRGPTSTTPSSTSTS